MLGIKGEFDVLNKHIGFPKAGAFFRGIAHVAQIGGNVEEKRAGNFSLLKRFYFLLKNL